MERLFDIDGGVIRHPPGFDEAVAAINAMIDQMEEAGIDRSDMRAMLDVMFGEARFRLLLLPSRQQKNSIFQEVIDAMDRVDCAGPERLRSGQGDREGGLQANDQ